MKAAKKTPSSRIHETAACVGKTYGALTVQKFVDFRRTDRGARVPFVQCRCSCGKIVEKSLWDMKGGKTSTCGLGHIQDPNEYPSVKKSLGKSFGKLTVEKVLRTRRMASGSKFVVVRCKCACGKTSNPLLTDVLAGKTTSCARGRCRQRYADRSMPAFNQLYRHAYRKRAIAAGLEFQLTEEEFRGLSKSACHYCGLSANASNAYGQGLCSVASVVSGKEKSIYRYNGVDRLDSSKGYTRQNVVPCCKTCNHAKKDLSYKDFLAWVSRLTKFHAEKSKA